MPTYDYQCGTCGNRFEKFQSFSEEPVRECPVCGQAVKKVISPAGIIFKGSGWYINDSKKTTTTTVPVPKDDEAKTEAVPVAKEGEAKTEAAPVAKDSETKTEKPKAEPAVKKSEAAA